MKRFILVSFISLACIFAIVLIWGYFVVLDRVEGQYVQSNGTKIHYTIEGKGEPVVLLHGFAVNAHLNRRLPGIIDELSKEFQVITIGLRHHGFGGNPCDKGKYGIQMADDVLNILSHLNIEKADLVRYSLGGFTTLKAAKRFPA